MFWHRNTDKEFTIDELERIAGDDEMFRAFLKDYGKRGLLCIKSLLKMACFELPIHLGVTLRCKSCPLVKDPCAFEECSPFLLGLFEKYGRHINPKDSMEI